MNELFWICVKLIQDLSRITGISYEELNIWLFVIINPLVSLLFIILYIRLLVLYGKLKKIKKISKKLGKSNKLN